MIRSSRGWKERLAAGRGNASALYRERRERGHAGASRQVHKWMQTPRVRPAKTTPPCRRHLPPVSGQAAASPLASPRQLAWRRLLQPAAKLDAAQKATVAQIEQDKAVRKAAALARRFTALVPASGVDALAGPGEILQRVGFADLRRRGAARPRLHPGRAAPRLQQRANRRATSTSSRLLKRRMYGRTRFDRLRRRRLLAS